MKQLYFIWNLYQSDPIRRGTWLFQVAVSLLTYLVAVIQVTVWISPVHFEIWAKSLHLLEFVSSPRAPHPLHKDVVNINIKGFEHSLRKAHLQIYGIK